MFRFRQLRRLLPYLFWGSVDAVLNCRSEAVCEKYTAAAYWLKMQPSAEELRKAEEWIAANRRPLRGEGECGGCGAGAKEWCSESCKWIDPYCPF